MNIQVVAYRSRSQINLEINEFISLKNLEEGKQGSNENKKFPLGKMFILTVLILACIEICIETG